MVYSILLHMKRTIQNDPEVLRAALIGYEHARDQVDTTIAQIRRTLGRPEASTATPRRTKRVLSEAARKRIAAAQIKRWAAYRKAKAST